MSTRTKITIIVSLSVLLIGMAIAGVSQADGWGPKGGPHFGHHGSWQDGHKGRHWKAHGGPKRMIRMFEAYDANRDGKLTQAEIDEGRAAQVVRFDADGDGALSLQEYEGLWLEAMRARLVDRFQFLDEDGDGVVTQTEFAEPFARVVTFMDRNDDDAISREDMRRWRRDYKEREDDDD